MSLPRLEIRIDLIRHNAEILVGRLAQRGIEVCGVTKATLGSAEVARELLAAGVTSLGESRIDNVEHLRQRGIEAEIMLIRSPPMSQVDRVVASTDVSLNTELAVIEHLSASARRQQRNHAIILMVELGDLREGIMPSDLLEVVEQVLDLPGITLRGIGTNLACQSGVIPDASNMGQLTDLTESVEAAFGLKLSVISGGNSASLGWALSPESSIGRVSQLRLGEAILLGRNPTDRMGIDGLHTDAIALLGEVIESKDKPMVPAGTRGQSAFGAAKQTQGADGTEERIIVALGRQDIDPEGIVAPLPLTSLGASSDHLVLTSMALEPAAVGSVIRFTLDYSALLRAMTSPFVARRFLQDSSTDPFMP